MTTFLKKATTTPLQRSCCTSHTTARVSSTSAHRLTTAADSSRRRSSLSARFALHPPQSLPPLIRHQSCISIMSEHKGGQATNDNKQQQQQSEDWTKNPPYALQDPNSKPKVMYSGSCHCKWVTFDLFKDPIDAHFCHCDVCQKLHGSAAHWSAIMEKPNVHFTCDPDHLSFYRTEDQSNERKLPLKVTCKRCHAPICDEGRNMMLMYPSLIDFEDVEHRDRFMPRRHIFYSFRCIDVHDNMDKWEKMPESSNLMEEDFEHQGKRGIAGQGSRQEDKPQQKKAKV